MFPDVNNPTYPGASVGPPTIDAVPTGIAYDGKSLFVSTLIGYPFPEKLAQIYQIDPGKTPVSPVVYRSGFSGITHLTFNASRQLMVTEFGFSTPGRIASGEDATKTLLGLAITPVNILPSSASAETYYLLQYGPGMLVKLTTGE